MPGGVVEIYVQLGGLCETGRVCRASPRSTVSARRRDVLKAFGPGGVTMVRRMWPRTRRAWTVVVLCALTFFVLNLLVLLGSDLALDLLVFLSGALVGAAVARLAAHFFGSAFGGSVVRRALGVFVGLASIFAIVFAGAAIAGIPAFPTAEGGRAGDLIYGLAMGFGLSAVRSLGGLDSDAPPEPPARSELKVAAVVLATVAALFGALFVAFLVIEYVAVPLIRSLAG